MSARSPLTTGRMHGRHRTPTTLPADTANPRGASRACDCTGHQMRWTACRWRYAHRTAWVRKVRTGV
jgi:hypothetical protein